MGVADGANVAQLRRQRNEIEHNLRDACLFADQARLRLEAALHGKTPIDRDDLQGTRRDLQSRAPAAPRRRRREVANLVNPEM